MTEAHDQAVTHRYVIHFPAHEPREGDPHYIDFEAYRRRTHATAVCAFDNADCDRTNPLELHHRIIEFALLNAVNLVALERDYPGVSDPDSVGAWVESATNLEWLCRFHHRGHGGAHVASAADFAAERYVPGMIE